MFRCAVLLYLSVLLYSTTSSPYKSWETEKHSAVQDTRYHDFDEKIVLGLKEVEPVEKQDLTEFDIDPHMAIWKAIKQFRQQKDNKPEEDKDNLQSDVQHLTGNLKPQNYRQSHLYQEAEKDSADIKDRVFQPEIPVFDKVEVVEQHKTSVYLTPEEDKDGLYHGDFGGQVFQVPVIFPEDYPKNVYTEPEEDQDHLFHS